MPKKITGLFEVRSKEGELLSINDDAIALVHGAFPFRPGDIIKGDKSLSEARIKRIDAAGGIIETEIRQFAEGLDPKVNYTTLAAAKEEDGQSNADLIKDIIIKKLAEAQDRELRNALFEKDALGAHVWRSSMVCSSSFFGPSSLSPLETFHFLRHRYPPARSPREEAWRMAMEHLTVLDLFELANQKLKGRTL